MNGFRWIHRTEHRGLCVEFCDYEDLDFKEVEPIGSTPPIRTCMFTLV